MYNRLGWMAALLVGSLLFAGCGGGNAGMATVKGKVTFNGTPIQDGAINLLPTDGQSGRVGGPITEGAYELTVDLAGESSRSFIVEISAFEAVGPPRGATEGDAEAESATRQIIPRQYNADSNLELVVDSNLVEKNFDLTP